MLLIALSIFDEKAAFYSPPFYCKTVNEGARSFSDALHSQGSALSAHPEDYSLYTIGSFDDNSGCFTPHSVPNFVMRGSAVDIV